MSIEKLLHRYTTGQEQGRDAEAVEDQGAYGMLRGIRDRATMVELRKKDGTVLAIPYVTIEQMLFSEDSGISIRSGGRDIKIAGRHLNDAGDAHLTLFSALARHLVPWIQEAPRSAVIGSGAASVVIESITW